ncbi:unnamed protein product, partial [Staurois parvus]
MVQTFGKKSNDEFFNNDKFTFLTKIINALFFAGKKMCIYYFCLQEPVKHCTSDQKIAEAMQVSCRPVRISA